jgi:hypothetical protein
MAETYLIVELNALIENRKNPEQYGNCRYNDQQRPQAEANW